MKMNECRCGCGGNTEMCSNYKESNLNYMFLGNLETIKRMIDEMVQMDARQVDEILKGGHDWAVDHIASSVDDIQEVYNFLKNRVSVSTDKKVDPFAEGDIFIKTFESYVNEVSAKRWGEIESHLRGDKMGAFADRVAAHSKQYGTGQVAEVKLIGMPTEGYDRSEVYLTVTDLEVSHEPGSNNFKIVGKDSDWGTVSIYGFTTNDGAIQMFESKRMPLLAIDRKNAMDLIKVLVDGGAIENSQLNWRLFTNGYTTFKDLYRI